MKNKTKMVRIATVLLRRKLKAMGSPREVGFVTQDNQYGTLYFCNDMKTAIIHRNEIVEVPVTIKVVINKTTINNGK